MKDDPFRTIVSINSTNHLMWAQEQDGVDKEAISRVLYKEEYSSKKIDAREYEGVSYDIWMAWDPYEAYTLKDIRTRDMYVPYCLCFVEKMPNEEDNVYYFRDVVFYLTDPAGNIRGFHHRLIRWVERAIKKVATDESFVRLRLSVWFD